MRKQVKRHAAVHREPARTDPYRPHFQAKQDNALAINTRGGVCRRNCQGKSRLAHRRPSGDDDQISLPEAAGLVVKIREAGRQANQAATGSIALVDVRQRPRHHFGGGNGGISW